MNPDMVNEVKDRLGRYANVTEISKLIGTFRCWRDHRPLTVHVYDSGIGGDQTRYWIQVIRDGIEVGRGNGGPTINDAIAVFHWSALNSEE
jgi:hypothetical protein